MARAPELLERGCGKVVIRQRVDHDGHDHRVVLGQRHREGARRASSLHQQPCDALPKPAIGGREQLVHLVAAAGGRDPSVDLAGVCGRPRRARHQLRQQPQGEAEAGECLWRAARLDGAFRRGADLIHPVRRAQQDGERDLVLTSVGVDGADVEVDGRIRAATPAAGRWPRGAQRRRRGSRSRRWPPRQDRDHPRERR